MFDASRSDVSDNLLLSPPKCWLIWQVCKQRHMPVMLSHLWSWKGGQPQ